MKKILVFTLAILMILLTACGTTEVPDDKTGTTKNTTAKDTTKAPQTTKKSDDTTENPTDTKVTPDTTAPVEINYEIGTLEDLLAFMNYPDLDGEYTLTKDIDFNDISNISSWSTTPPENVWTPVGNTLAPFAGTFNGQGHKIIGLYIKTFTGAGFFNCIDDATVENLIIGEGYIHATDNVAGAISAYYHGEAVVRGCVNYASVTGRAYVGGLLGKYSVSSDIDATVELCVNRGTVTGTLDTSSTGYIGGIVGYCVGMTIDRCANFGDVSIGVGYSQIGAIVGGITGIMGSSQGYAETIINCYNAGNILSSQAAGNAATAGIVGRMHLSNGEVANCYNIGNIYVSGKEVKMAAYVAAEDKDKTDYTRNVYNGGKMYLINTTEELMPSFTEKGFKGSVITGIGAVAYMEIDTDIWEDSIVGGPILKGIDLSHQTFN